MIDGEAEYAAHMRAEYDRDLVEAQNAEIARAILGPGHLEDMEGRAMKTSGQIAFEAYNEAKGGLTYDGKPIPPWESLVGETGEAVRRAWQIAASVVEARAELRAVAVALVECGAMMCMLEAGWPPAKTFASFVKHKDIGRSRADFGDLPARILGREPTDAEWTIIVEEATAYARSHS